MCFVVVLVVGELVEDDLVVVCVVLEEVMVNNVMDMVVIEEQFVVVLLVKEVVEVEFVVLQLISEEFVEQCCSLDECLVEVLIVCQVLESQVDSLLQIMLEIV